MTINSGRIMAEEGEHSRRDRGIHERDRGLDNSDDSEEQQQQRHKRRRRKHSAAPTNMEDKNRVTGSDQQRLMSVQSTQVDGDTLSRDPTNSVASMQQDRIIQGLGPLLWGQQQQQQPAPLDLLSLQRIGSGPNNNLQQLQLLLALQQQQQQQQPVQQNITSSVPITTGLPIEQQLSLLSQSNPLLIQCLVQNLQQQNVPGIVGSTSPATTMPIPNYTGLFSQLLAQQQNIPAFQAPSASLLGNQGNPVMGGTGSNNAAIAAILSGASAVVQQQLQQQQQQQQQQPKPQQDVVASRNRKATTPKERDDIREKQSSKVSDDDVALTGRCPVALYISCDDDSLSEYQCLVRKQIELFEATRADVESNAQGRNRPVVLGQVGIRCRHCNMLPPKHRSRGAIYYPAKLLGAYQAAQNMASGHLCEYCQHMPPDLRDQLVRLRDRKSSAGGGKKYWADAISVLGVYEDQTGLRFEKR